MAYEQIKGIRGKPDPKTIEETALMLNRQQLTENQLTDCTLKRLTLPKYTLTTNVARVHASHPLHHKEQSLGL